MQRVLYEGISSLCFCCGRVGHKQENCSYYVKQIPKENDGQVSPKANEANKTMEEVQSNPKYGPWMVVTRRKSANRLGRASDQLKPTK